MRQFLDVLQDIFTVDAGWNWDNAYNKLTASSRGILDFSTPRGLRMDLSSLSTQLFATSYRIESLGGTGLDGSIAYLFSSVPLSALRTSAAIDLHTVSKSYRQLEELRTPAFIQHWETWCAGERVDKKPSLLYGRMFLPTSQLEALYLRVLSPTLMLRTAAVSDARIKNGGTINAMLMQDTGKWGANYFYSTDVGLVGLSGLYNFGRDPRHSYVIKKRSGEANGRFSVGAEAYYGILNKSVGMSTGVRYATLPTHPGIPLTMTLTLNPIMGHLEATYATATGSDGSAFSTRYMFNLFSYESDLVFGCELWRRSSGSLQHEQDITIKKDLAGVVKAKVGVKGNIGLLWEGRIKELLFSLGAGLDFKKRDASGLVKHVGLEVSYSS